MRLRTRTAKCTQEDFSSAHIWTVFRMEQQRSKVCGADNHKRFLVATILSRDGAKATQRFKMNVDTLLKFKEWVIDNGCEQVAIESTGTYWYPIQAVLEGSIDLILAHPYKIKHIPGRKKDQLDSEWSCRALFEWVDRAFEGISQGR